MIPVDMRSETTTATPAALYSSPMSPGIEFPHVSPSPLFTNRGANQKKIKVLFAFTCAGSWSEQNAKQQRAAQLLGRVQRKQG
ncbi:hypothetical protein KUCAC02_014467 [Chaenocephalus aceratus]|uniref:Uncharacterized protein n=1 Tax=Chaenocephalus aceratus TaxID=36190 RepID=A0ACB9WEY3_CHAAC|nr:hypothetical protein KUCAC02_014467 [Chaenocephalus aceratus]